MSPVDLHFVSISDLARRLWVDGTTSIYATLSESLTKSRGVPPVANVSPGLVVMSEYHPETIWRPSVTMRMGPVSQLGV